MDTELSAGEAEETSDALCGDWRILQLRHGHRFSTDDLVTAWYGAVVRPEARVVLDLGCGIGSVALMLAHQLPSAAIDGVEAQSVSLDLGRRSVAYNDLEGRVILRAGDLREASAIPRPGQYELVTGTPPYIPPGRGRMSPNSQRAHCRFELRGGIEEYAVAAERALAPDGAFVACFDARFPERVERAAEAAGLAIVRSREVIPRAGRPALFTMFALEKRATSAPTREPPLIVRDETGIRTAEMKSIRQRLAMPLTD